MYRDIYPKEWADSLDIKDTFIDEYPSITHFKQKVKHLKQHKDMMCDISYKDALKDLLTNKSTMTNKDYEVIKNRVKNSLLKRGLISENIYESYKYEVEGDLVDVAKVIEGDPACCLVPNKKYKNYFYELYISIAYPYTISNSVVMENMAKILATVELLEREHIYCKISLVLPNRGCNTGSGLKNYLGLIPLFSHRETKSIELMSSVLNDRLLRKFFFAVWEDKYKDNLVDGYGTPIDLDKTIKPVNLDECELASSIINEVIVPGEQ